MTKQEIRDGAPDGSTHHDGVDYWKNEDCYWFIWFESNQTWNQIIEYEIFHNTFNIQPL